ncbi:protein of unknown function [Burkholderia multivorans]
MQGRLTDGFGHQPDARRTRRRAKHALHVSVIRAAPARLIHVNGPYTRAGTLVFPTPHAAAPVRWREET